MRHALPTLALALGLVAGDAVARPPAPPVPPTPPMAPLAPTPPAAPIASVAPTPPTPPSPPVAWWSGSFSFGRGRLGIQVSSMTPELRVFFGAPEDAGMLVQRVEEKTPAERAGVTVGDVVVEIDGDRIEDVSDVAEALADRSKGDKVGVVVVRGKKRKSLTATIDDDASAMPGAMRLSLPPLDRDLERKLDEALERLEALEKRIDGGTAKPRRKPEPAKKPRRKPTRDEA